MTSQHKIGRRLIATMLSAVCAAIFLMVSGTASAQLSGKGAVSGIVQDPSGAAIPGATITATKTETGVATSTTSTSAGDFSINTLDPGMYTVTVTAPGFEKLTQQNVQINALETQSFSPKMTVGGGSENVTVSTIPPQLETTNATLGATMDEEMYSSLPVEMGAYGQADQRRATDFAFLMPGVQSNNTNGNATTNTGVVNGSGSRGAASDVYIDGVPFVRAGGNGDPRFVWTAISVDAVDQFQVQTNGYSAMYEGQGLQNYTVKQGGQKYHGAVYEFFRNTTLDTWGWLGPSVPNPVAGHPTKPIEHSNEYGINLSGPLVPFGKWREKVFAFGNYNGFRYASQNPTLQTFPTPAQQQGNFQTVLNTNVATGCTGLAGQTCELINPVGVGIYDPSTQNACTGNNGGKPCRYRYGFGPGGTATTADPGGAIVQCAAPYTCVDVIPSGQFQPIPLKMQSFLPTGISSALQNNLVAPNRTGLTNWSTTDRIDWVITPKHTLTMVGAIGRQASSNPTGQTTAGRNVGPIPYNYGQTFAPKTAVGVIEETFIITPHLVNQIKYGYSRYNGPTYDADQLPQYSATTMGINNAPAGAAAGAFPITTFAGTNTPTNWGGTSPNVTLAENYSVVDNVQWVKGQHTLTVGGQVAWLLYNVISNTGGTSAMTFANAATETAGLNNAITTISGSGTGYASFLVGQVDTISFTQSLQQEFGARFRAISPYIQDNWKVNSKLTLDLGLRWDYYPSVKEVHDAGSFFSPTLANTVTGLPGALQFTGHGAGTCNCDTPVNNYKKGFGPRIGLAYQIDPKTVIRASWGVMFSHGDAVGGLATSLGTLGFSAAAKFSPTSSDLSSVPLVGTSVALPAYTAACGVASGNQDGTGNYNGTGPASCVTGNVSYTGTPSGGTGYPDPYLGGRAPEYVNWSFGFQHQWTNALTSSISYVGSQGHFLQTDSSNARGFWSDQLDPKYLYLTTKLSDLNAALTADCANASLGITCPTNFNPGASGGLATALKPFPFQSVSDLFGYVANSNYNALQATLNMRAWHGLTFMANYTWSRTIDDGGTFRTGYAIPAAFSMDGLAHSQDRIERSVSTTNQPQHVVVTGVYALPFGKTVANHYAWERAVFGGFKVSEIFQAFSGSPLSITASSCQTNPALTCNEPNTNPNFIGSARVNGKWGAGALAGLGNVSYLAASTNVSATPSTTCVPSGPFIPTSTPCIGSAFAPSYTIPSTPRTAPYDLYGPGNYQVDLSISRSFPLHFTETARFDFRAEMFNLTNKTFFAVASAQVGNAAFGTVTTSPNYNRRAAQLDARITF